MVMAECDACGKDSDRLLYTCNECGKKVCSDCRLPENHLCGVRDRVDEPRQWNRGSASNTTTSPVEGEDARADCKSDDCTNTSDVGSPFCPECLNKEEADGVWDAPLSEDTSRKCAASTCKNSVTDSNRYCLDCRRKRANSSSAPAVETVDGSPYNSAPSSNTSSGPSARARARSALNTAAGVALSPFVVAYTVLLYLYAFLTSKTGIALVSVALIALAAGPLGLVSIHPDQIGGAVANMTEGDEQVKDPSPSTDSRNGWNEELVERYFIIYLNQDRSDRGLQNVTERGILAKMGESHSENMVANDYFDHTQPDGTTIEDRYRERGLLPECRLDTKEGGYYPGAENIAKTHVNVDVVTDDGDTVYLDSERDLAKHLVTMWMNSKGHREAMLVYSADEAGLGLAFDNDAVYASLELC